MGAAETEERVARAIDILMRAGYRRNGTTPETNRQRFRVPGTNKCVTVGPRTVNFYHSTDYVAEVEGYATKDHDGIRQAAERWTRQWGGGGGWLQRTAAFAAVSAVLALLVWLS